MSHKVLRSEAKAVIDVTDWLNKVPHRARLMGEIAVLGDDPNDIMASITWSDDAMEWAIEFLPEVGSQ